MIHVYFIFVWFFEMELDFNLRLVGLTSFRKFNHLQRKMISFITFIMFMILYLSSPVRVHHTLDMFIKLCLVLKTKVAWRTKRSYHSTSCFVALFCFFSILTSSSSNSETWTNWSLDQLKCFIKSLVLI